MKKSMSVMLILTLLLMLFVSSTALAQDAEPTEEPTVELTEEPTEEPAAESTEEATVEPTEEPTAEPTEEPTAEPTEEPTAEPTEEPTAEPTEEPTAEPTEEPTAEPTEEPTAEPTEEPTAEPTEEPVIESEDAGEIGASAVVGSWTSDYILIQNLSTTDQANATLTLYNTSGGSAGSIDKTGIPINGSARIRTTDSGFPGNGQYSGIVSSDQPVAAAVMNNNSSYRSGDAYVGFAGGSSNPTADILYFPNTFRGHFGWTTKLHIQDASGSGQRVTVHAYPNGSSSPSDSPEYDIDPNGFITVDLMSSDFSNFGSGNGAYGYVRVESNDGRALAAICDNIVDQNQGPNKVVEAQYEGLDASQAGRDFVAPIVFNGHAGWYTGVNIVNTTGTPTTMTFTYKVNSAYGGATQVRTLNVPAYQKGTFFLPETTLQKPSYGSLTINSANADVTIVVGTNRLYDPDDPAVGYMVRSLNPAAATNHIAIPIAFRQSPSGTWNGGINVYTVGSASTITTKWVRTDSDPTVSTNYFDYSLPGVSNGAVTFFAPEMPGMLNNFTGVVYIESSSPILALSGGNNFTEGYSYQITGYSYTP